MEISKIYKTITIDSDVFEAVEEQRGRKMRSPFISEVLRKALKVPK